MRKLIAPLLCLLLAASPALHAADDTQPLKSAAPDGLGPISLHSLSNIPIGTAYVYGSERPDLFVLGRTKKTQLALFKWAYDAPDGSPVFEPPVSIEGPLETRGTIFQTPDGVIHCLWHKGRTIQHSVFNTDTLSFGSPREIAVPGLSAPPASLSAVPNPDGSFEIVFDLSGESKPRSHPETNASSADWRPYDSDGTSTEGYRYRYLAAARLPSIEATSTEPARQLSPTQREVYFGMTQFAPTNFGEGHQRGVITGARMGIFSYYQNTSPNGLETPKRTYAVDPDGIVMRHPSTGSAPITYPRRGDPTHSDLISGGESALQFYKHIGNTPEGSPMFEHPAPLLQRNAELYTGTLPSFSIYDWDGDGVDDMICGNSEGYVLFFKNIGTNDEPAFLPGVRVQAGGRDIHIQAGYSGSVQGTKEARWGYNSPTVVDWNGDGLPDIIMGDVTGEYTVYINRGTLTEPLFDAPRPIYCDGIPLHGTWRCQPAVGKLGGRMAMITLDDDDQFHLYWRLDDHNVEDGGKLTLSDGRLINGSYDPAGGTGRIKLSFFDVYEDGLPDLVIGTGRRSAIPDRNDGWPMPSLGMRTLGTPLLMKNVGTPEKPVFEMPIPFVHRTLGVIQPGGSHERGAVLTELGGDGPNLLTANENGQVYLYKGKNMQVIK